MENLTPIEYLENSKYCSIRFIMARPPMSSNTNTKGGKLVVNTGLSDDDLYNPEKQNSRKAEFNVKLPEEK